MPRKCAHRNSPEPGIVPAIPARNSRHTYSTMLRAAGVDIKVQQELLRHATIQSTLNVYTQAISEQKRTANTQLVEMVLLNKARPTSALTGLERERILD